MLLLGPRRHEAQHSEVHFKCTEFRTSLCGCMGIREPVPELSRNTGEFAAAIHTFTNPHCHKKQLYHPQQINAKWEHRLDSV
eukprot:1178047-Prorocentrum_minimum.AAC.3